MTLLKNMSVGLKLGLGFTLTTLVLFASVGISLTRSQEIDDTTRRVVELRLPTAQASLMMQNGMNHSLAALRGWMLLGEEKFKTERAAAWSEEIMPSLKVMQAFSADWTEPENVRGLTIIESDLKEFRRFQEEIETIAQAPENLPANQILLDQAAPQGAILLDRITRIIDIEAGLAATPSRKALLGSMADTRGTTARALANIRAYLLSGDVVFKDRFDKMWSKNSKRFGHLMKSRRQLTAKQSILLREFAQARTLFAPLPQEMFRIRGGQNWNQANVLLSTKAAPTAFAIKQRLSMMIASQETLLDSDMVASKELSASMTETLWLLILIGGGLCALLGIVVTRSVTVPLAKLTQVARSLSEGKLNEEPARIGSTDELGVLGDSMDGLQSMVASFVDGLESVLGGDTSLVASAYPGDFGVSMQGIIVQAREKLSSEAREQERVAELRANVDSMLRVVSAASAGDLTQQVSVGGDDAIGQMGAALGDFLGKLRSSMKGLGQNADRVFDSSRQLSTVSDRMTDDADRTAAQSGAVSAASEQISRNIDTVAVSTEEMSASVHEIARNASEAAEVSRNALSLAVDTSALITKLGHSSDEIGQVVQVITSIADQTSLLALNATIEAAGAGDAGRGFAVVASEVKELARQTAMATDEITAKITAIQNDTGKSVAAISGIREVIDKLNTISTSIACAVEEQAAATSEIGRNVSEAASGTAEIAENITGVATAAQGTTVGAAQAQRAANDLAEMASSMKSLVGQFRV